MYVFAQECRERIKTYVTKNTRYKTKHLIFDATVQRGQYVKARAFLDTYAKPCDKKHTLGYNVDSIDLPEF